MKQSRKLSRRAYLTTSAGALAGTAFLADSTLSRAEPSGKPGATGLPNAESGKRKLLFRFLHSYEATGRYWQGLEKAGLIRENIGVRLVNSPWGEDGRRFNKVARLGGSLHRIISERQYPLIVDRVCGGAPYREYDFDASLVKAYASLLGNDFLGGQVHEAVSNSKNDWNRFIRIDPKYRNEPINAEALKSHFDWSEGERWLEYGTLDDYAGQVFPDSIDAFWTQILQSSKRQAERFQSHFSYCEGSRHGELAWHDFYQLGADLCLAEVGAWASRQTQFMIASLRGAAKAAGKPWGVSFAPWGPSGCTCFVPLADTSWQAPEEEIRKSWGPVDAESGPSTALQRRIFFHSYLSGAHTLHEEWGAECNLTDWDRGSLSSSGRVTRDLLDFQEAYPDVGKPYTPIALVLDVSQAPPVAFGKAADGGKVHHFFEPRPIDVAWAKLKQGLFRNNVPAGGFGSAEHKKQLTAGARGELQCFAPCAFPEIFDIVPSDSPDVVWSNYREVIAIGEPESPAHAKRYPVDAQFDQLAEAIGRMSPVSKSGVLPMQINFRESDGAWILALHNPFGAHRGDVDGVGSILDDRFIARERLQPTFPWKSARAIYAWPESSTLSTNGSELHAVVGPGGTLIVELT